MTLKPWKRRPQTEQTRAGKKIRWRNTAQMTEKGRNSQDQINKEEIGKLPEKKELRIMIVKMF